MTSFIRHVFICFLWFSFWILTRSSGYEVNELLNIDTLQMHRIYLRVGRITCLIFIFNMNFKPTAIACHLQIKCDHDDRLSYIIHLFFKISFCAFIILSQKTSCFSFFLNSTSIFPLQRSPCHKSLQHMHHALPKQQPFSNLY